MRNYLITTVFSLTMLTVAPALAGPEHEIDDEGILKRNRTADATNVGDLVSEFSFHDVTGKAHHMSDLTAKGPAVFVFLSTECPLAKRYTARLNRLQAEFAPKAVSMLGVFSNAGLTAKEVRVLAKDWGYSFPAVKDYHGYLARKLDAGMTPEVMVVGRDGRIAYRGAIDDERFENEVKHSYLRNALRELTTGLPVSLPETECLGCTLHLPTAEHTKEITYGRHISRVLQDNCTMCHREGEVAPFSLTSYDKARTWATEIKHYTHARLMPPWKHEPGFNRFSNALRVSDEELALIDKWIEGGMQKGNLDEVPPTPKRPEGWAFGEPDLILQMPEEYEVGAEGPDDYRHFIIPTNFDRDMYISAVDVRPGNRQVVHHVVGFTDTTGEARKLDAEAPGLGYTRVGGPGFEPASIVAAWAPGTQPLKSPPTIGTLLPKGADVVLQVHYYRSGRVEKDRSRIGIYFSKAAKPIRLRTAWVYNKEFVIPANKNDVKVQSSKVFEEDVYALAVYPHMHMLGKDMKVTAELPDGTTEPIIKIKDWDFNWQFGYAFKRPKLLPKGTRIDVIGVYDNTEDNPDNPSSPPRDVTYGEATTDEMCLALVVYLNKQEVEAAKKALARRIVQGERSAD